MTPDATVVEVLRTLLPLGTAIIGFLGGLAAIPLTERARRDSARIERQRAAIAGLLHVLADSVMLPQGPRDEASNRFVVAGTEAGYLVGLELSKADSIQFQLWYDARTKSLYALLGGRGDAGGFTAYAKAVDDLLDDLMKYHRGESTIADLPR